MWSAIFAALLFAANAFSVKLFAETEFWFSSVKIVTILLFIILGGGVWDTDLGKDRDKRTFNHTGFLPGDQSGQHKNGADKKDDRSPGDISDRTRNIFCRIGGFTRRNSES